MASLSFDGKLNIDQYHKWNRQDADTIASQWWEEYGADIPALKWRYGKVKEVARRSIRKPATPSRASSRTDPGLSAVFAMSGIVVTGRNDPCPCGSGKKYKRCCGA